MLKKERKKKEERITRGEKRMDKKGQKSLDKSAEKWVEK